MLLLNKFCTAQCAVLSILQPGHGAQILVESEPSPSLSDRYTAGEVTRDITRECADSQRPHCPLQFDGERTAGECSPVLSRGECRHTSPTLRKHEGNAWQPEFRTKPSIPADRKHVDVGTFKQHHRRIYPAVKPRSWFSLPGPFSCAYYFRSSCCWAAIGFVVG